MTNAEELRERIRVMFVESWARWTPDERAQVLARLPAYQREGWTKLIENHLPTTAAPTGLTAQQQTNLARLQGMQASGEKLGPQQQENLARLQ